MEIQSVKDFIKKLQSQGLPIILLQDPKTKEPSLSFTLVVLAAIYCAMGIFSNYFVFLKGINVEAAFNFFLASASLYWGRKLSLNGKSANSEKQE